MKKGLYLLSQILDLSSSEIKSIIDSRMRVYELIFSNGDYLQECLKLDKSLISRISALKELILETFTLAIDLINSENTGSF